ncbi:Inner centromere protein, ARK-binding domain-containing protein [Strongyloides ratti]|uniref:Inner centromere protein, ARK-binding domain-containing protein n=1 Tax=Strongyloides ratti TaxID=34506 RepID=A0A090KYH0_STRRB|nr:Inner centromere protein, ARK-binding domain-containing protein [Strongyloides ratti]CEF62570.1 Inner centromere protein, ARK-binding domain-containing protein [Strongyloides ratti]
MASRQQKRKFLGRKNGERQANKYLSQLCEDDFILESPSIVFPDVIPDYEFMEHKVKEIANIYDRDTLDCIEEIKKILNKQRNNLKDLIMKMNNKSESPKSTLHGKNISKIERVYKLVEDRKDKVTGKDIINSTDMSYDSISEVKESNISLNLQSTFVNVASDASGSFESKKEESLKLKPIFSSPKKNNEIANNCVTVIQQNKNIQNEVKQDLFLEFEAQMKSSEVTNIFSSPLLNSTKFNNSLICGVEYETKFFEVSHLSTEHDYNIIDLSDRDTTDDEDNPRKIVPKWAHVEHLQPALKKQNQKFRNVTDFSVIFGKVNDFNTETIFKKTKYTRTSSKLWSSPLCTTTEVKSIYQKLNGSASDSLLFDE